MEPKARDMYWMLEGRKRDFFVCTKPDEEPPGVVRRFGTVLGTSGVVASTGYARFTH